MNPTEEFSTRVTPRPGENPLPRPKHTPGALAISERQKADFWKLVGLGTSLASLMLAFLVIQAGRATERVYVLDSAGSLYTGLLEPISESRGYFNIAALYATNAALQRSTAGFDLYEVLKLCFTSRAVQKMEDDLQSVREDIRRRNLQQKPLIDSIGDPVTAGSARLVEVRGRLVCAGAYAGRSFYDEQPFVLLLTFRRNSDLGKAAAYPWICDDFDLTVKALKTTKPGSVEE